MPQYGFLSRFLKRRLFDIGQWRGTENPQKLVIQDLWYLEVRSREICGYFGELSLNPVLISIMHLILNDHSLRENCLTKIAFWIMSSACLQNTLIVAIRKIKQKHKVPYFKNSMIIYEHERFNDMYSEPCIMPIVDLVGSFLWHRHAFYPKWHCQEDFLGASAKDLRFMVSTLKACTSCGSRQACK